MGETKQTLNIRAKDHITAIESASKRSPLQSTAGNTIMTLTGNIRKYWTLRKTGKQEPSRRQSTQKKTSIISMEYPSSYQIFGNQYYEKAKQRKQLPKLQHHQTESTNSANKYGSIQVHNQSQPIRNDLKIFRCSANTCTLTHVA